MYRRLFVLMLLGAPICLSAQPDSPSGSRIPTIPLGRIVAACADSLGAQATARALSNGSVLVSDYARHRVLLFDSTLTHGVSVIDSIASASNFQTAAQLIPYRGDSTLFVDVATNVLLVIDQTGKLARTMALPKPRDSRYLAGTIFGAAGIDAKGRLVYRAAYPMVVNTPPAGSPTLMAMPSQPDSGVIVRADFDSRTVDTLTTLKIMQTESAMTMKQDGRGNITMKITINPVDAGDEWAMLSDGTIAIVRAHDYHVDWMDPDGTRRSSAKMPFDWRPVTAEQKQKLIDSLRPIYQRQIEGMPARKTTTPEGERDFRTEIDFVSLRQMPDYEPPIGQGSVKADRKGNLWILPHTSLSARGGVLYDVVNKRGEITKRVQLPAGYALIGFGNGDDVFVIRVSGKTGFIEKASVN
ncbi:MAG: hypothetical protein ABJB66_05975 [Gemmatimonadaceae bacterium]